MKKNTRTIIYIVSDFLAAITSWILFYIFRKAYIESPMFGVKVPVDPNLKFWISLLAVPVFWIILHYISGYYKDPYRKSRLQELGQTFLFSLIGVLILFFTLLLDDTIYNYKNYYSSISVLFFLQFFLTYIPRLILTTSTIEKIRSGRIGFNTLLVGGNGRAMEIYQKMTSLPKSSGNKIVGFIHVNDGPSSRLENADCLGDQTILVLHVAPRVLPPYKIQAVPSRSRRTDVRLDENGSIRPTLRLTTLTRESQHRRCGIHTCHMGYLAEAQEESHARPARTTEVDAPPAFLDPGTFRQVVRGLQAADVDLFAH